MADRESTAVGYRLRLQPPGGLSTYPDRVKLMWFQWVVDLGLVAKDRELARGMDKDGKIGVLHPATIKHRKSEVGPTTKTAPFLTPSYARSRVRSLLTGRAHTGSAEFWWSFDAVTGRSFARILHYQAENGHDVFGLSPAGTAWVTAEALKRWRAWLAEGHHGRPSVSPVGRPIRKAAVLKPVKQDIGIMTTKGFDIAGNEAQIQRAIDAGTFSGFRRLNARGEKWRPQVAWEIKPQRAVKPTPQVARAALQPAPAPLPTFGPSPARAEVDPDAPAQALHTIKRLLGKQATARTAADLSGAPAGTTATVARGYGQDSLLVYVSGPGVDIKREIRRDLDGHLVIHNVTLFLAREKQGHGIGTETLGRQIETAQRAGVDHIYLAAGGSPQDTSMVGFKVWPLMGFNGELRDSIRWELPEALKHCKTIADLYATPEGRQWWAEHGESIGLKFDLTPGSYSLRTWEAYLRERQARGKP